MPFLSVSLSCVVLFLVYSFGSRLVVAIAIFALSVGYQVLSYSHYFGGGWEAAGNKHPFNEELIFALMVLSLTASCFGFMAWILHHRVRFFGEGGIAKIKTFAAVFVGFVVTGGVLVMAVPLSFEMPIDLSLCDSSVSQPDYCP